MKKVIILSLLLGWQFISAQETYHQTKEVANHLNWLTDFNQAKAIAKKEHKPILMLFTGSDWCPPCRAMHNELFPNEEFQRVAKDVVLVMVDFPRRKPMSKEQRAKNDILRRKFHKGGVPTFIAVTYDEKFLGKMGGYRFGHPERNIDFFKQMIEKNKKKTQK